MDHVFTQKLQAWLNLPREERDWEVGAMMLLQLSGNKIMYRNISVNPKGKAEFIEGKLQQYLKFRLAALTHEQVKEMEQQVETIMEKRSQFEAEVNEAKNFKAGKRADHDALPEEIQALYVENLDLVHRMRELHLKLRTMSTSTAVCADSERYPFLKEFIFLDKKLHDNWDRYDHFVITEPSATTEPCAPSEQNELNVPSEPCAQGEQNEPSAPNEPKKAKKSGKTNVPSETSEPTEPSASSVPSEPSERNAPSEPNAPQGSASSEQNGENLSAKSPKNEKKSKKRAAKE